MSSLTEKMTDRVVPRALTSLAVAAISMGGTYELIDHLEIPASEQNAKVNSCADQLGKHATQVVSPPSECQQFETSFFYHDLVVRVSMPGKTDEESATKTKKVFDLPPAQAFHDTKIQSVPKDRSSRNTLKISFAVIGIMEAVILFGISTGGARRRRAWRTEMAADSVEA